MAIFYAIIFSSVLALANVSIGYFSEKWLFGVENPERTVAKMMAIMWLANGILTPIFGVLIDYFGHRSAMVINF
jgi:MFS family permease